MIQYDNHIIIIKRQISSVVRTVHIHVISKCCPGCDVLENLIKVRHMFATVCCECYKIDIENKHTINKANAGGKQGEDEDDRFLMRPATFL